MDRKEFLRSTCGLGLCACTGMLLAGKAGAKEKAAECPPPKDEWKLDFVQNRFSKFVDVIDQQVDPDTRDQMFGKFGEVCSNESVGQFKQYIGNIDGFLQYIRENWVESAEFDKARNEITITGKPSDKCFCPFVGNSKMSTNFCNCSTGWMKQTYGAILGKKVEAKATATVLRGDDRCSFKIQILG